MIVMMMKGAEGDEDREDVMSSFQMEKGRTKAWVWGPGGPRWKPLPSGGGGVLPR